MRAACARLLDRAQKAGTVRSGVTAGEVIALAVGLACAAQQPGVPTNSMARLLSTAMQCTAWLFPDSRGAGWVLDGGQLF